MEAQVGVHQIGSTSTPVPSSLVWAAVELYDELQLGAVEIDDESLEHMLATELEAEHAAIAEQAPRMPFCGRRLTAQLSGQGELSPDGDAPQWIHASG